jgi:hypothetical protein
VNTPASTFDAVVHQLAAGAADYFGDAHAAVDPVGSREGLYSSVMRVRIRTAAGESYAYVKVFKPQGSGPASDKHVRWLLDNEYAITKRLHDACTSQPGLAPLRPLAVFPDQLALVTAEAPGQTFDRVLKAALWGFRSSSFVVEAARRIGVWVRTYQHVPPHGKVTAGREYLDLRLQKLVGTVLTPDDREFALRAFETLQAQAGSLADPSFAIHGDLCPANIIVQPAGEITVLDFATAKTGTRYHDPAHLYLHLEFVAARMPLRRRFITAVQLALLSELNPPAKPTDPAFKLMLLQHCACYTAMLSQDNFGKGPRRMRVLARKWRRHLPLWAPDAPAC